ncbi:MAG: hypothetical protein ACHQ9S_02570 [Candidatus Binatia bacterium]
MASKAGAGSTGRRRLGTLAAVAIIVTYYLVRFRDCILNFFSLDDFWIMRDAAQIHMMSPWDITQIFYFNHNGFLLYRPLTQGGYFFVLRQLFAYDASAYHAAHLLAHILAALLVFGIARRLTQSTIVALAAALIYAAAPGHISAVYWLAAFSMTGCALAVLTTLYLWLRLEGTVRLVACTILQAVGLLAGEHAVVVPVLLLALERSRPRSKPLGGLVRDLAAPTVLAGVYLSLKIIYLIRFPPAPIEHGYALSFDALGWLTRLGRYGAGCFNLFTLLSPHEPALMAGGGVVLGAAVLATWQLLRGRQRFQLLALGSAVFVVSLLPVLPLREHQYDYFVGVAAMGAALAVLGLCQAVGVAWRKLAVMVALAIITVDIATAGRAARSAALLKLVVGDGDASASWVMSVQRAGLLVPGINDVLVPADKLTQFLFVDTRAQEHFPPMPRVALYDRARPPAPVAGSIALRAPIVVRRRNDPLPGWRERWAWLRRCASTTWP